MADVYTVRVDADGTIGYVPTPITTMRIPVELKAAAKAKAANEGRTLTDVIVTLLGEYVSGGTK